MLGTCLLSVTILISRMTSLAHVYYPNLSNEDMLGTRLTYPNPNAALMKRRLHSISRQTQPIFLEAKDYKTVGPILELARSQPHQKV